MPHLPVNADDVRLHLEALLPTASFRSELAHPAYHPLLTMRYGHSIVTFAFANGDAKQSYDLLYGHFKREFRNNDEGSPDLAFVFCLSTPPSNLDEFSSSVETDIYFCRKFVVLLAQPIGSSLSRLPFLPLAPPSHHGSTRPPSAQTLLQQSGVSPLLARLLVVQQERSAQGIVEDCLHGRFGTPAPLENVRPGETSLQIESEAKPVRLESVTIRNFRAYRASRTFEFGANITILYGPNGFGKTSLFDAIDFAATGSIGRLSINRESQLIKVARHLDAAHEQCLVKLSFTADGKGHEIVRDVDTPKHALLDGEASNRKSILARLTSGRPSTGDRIENQISLFRASHLFSQERQELAHDFQRDSTLSGDIVSRMLAFDDYVNAVNKANQVKRLLDLSVTAARHDAERLEAEIADDEQALYLLNQKALSHVTYEADPEDFISRIVNEVRDAGIDVGDTASPDLRRWRALIEAQEIHRGQRRDRLLSLAGKVAERPRLQDEVELAQQQSEQSSRGLDEARENRLKLEAALSEQEGRLTALMAERDKSRADFDSIQFIGEQLLEYLRLKELLQKQEVELQTALDSLSGAREREKPALDSFQKARSRAVDLARRREDTQQQLASAEDFLFAVPNWLANQDKRQAIVSEQLSLRQRKERLEQEESTQNSRMVALQREEAGLRSEIAAEEAKLSKVRALLSQLQEFVDSATCPLCGQDHGNQDLLLQRIQTQTVSDSASEARAELPIVIATVQELHDRQIATRNDIHSVEFRLKALDKLVEEIDAGTDAMTATASALGIALPLTATDKLEEEARQVKSDRQAKVEELQGLENVALTDAATARQAVEIETTVEECKRLKTRAESSLEQTRQELDRLCENPRLRDRKFLTDPKQVETFRRQASQQVDEVIATVASTEDEIRRSRSELSALKGRIEALEQRVDELNVQKHRLQARISEPATELLECDLPSDSTEQALIQLSVQEDRARTRLALLRERVGSAEVAIDAATTSAALARQRDAIREKRNALDALNSSRLQSLPWLEYFDRIAKRLQQQQDTATENFTVSYGPRASTIQQRLRSVYGFDEIELLSRASSIAVRVTRNGEHLRPVDYFSQSQQQTLLLGLFLAACSSQNWSSFSSVLLDDPVTHFDDLNTYAFLDLLTGLLRSDLVPHQFVISTCDSFLQLARQKFAYMGDRVKFYRFLSIGEDGPTVEALP